MGLFLILSIKDGPVKCAKVFDKSVVILMDGLTFGETQCQCFEGQVSKPYNDQGMRPRPNDIACGDAF